jgi:hypothetical protein
MAEALNWFLDGTKIFGVSGAEVGYQTAWKALAHDEHFLLLNVAVGGSWPGGPNSQTINGPSVGMEVELTMPKEYGKRKREKKVERW